MARRRQFSFDNTRAILQQQFQQEDAVKLAVLREMLNRQSQEQDDVRTSEERRRQEEFTRTQSYLTNPDVAVNAARSGISGADKFVPPVSSRADSIRSMYAGKGSLADLPSAQSIEGAAGGLFGVDRPFIDQLLAERKAEEERLSPLQPRSAVKSKLPTGEEQTQYLTPQETAGRTFTTSLSAAQEGANQATQTLAANSPAVENQRVREAGRTAGAQASARQAVEMSPQAIAARIDEFKQKATIEAANQRDLAGAKAAQDAANASLSASMALDQVKTLYDQVKLSRGDWGVGTRALGRKIGSATGTLDFVNPQAAELDRLAGGYAMLLYRGFGGTGAQVSDRDLQMMTGAIPFSHVIAEVGDEVFSNSAMLLQFNPMIKARYGSQPFERQMSIAQEWLKRYKNSQNNGDTQFEDPFSPGKFVPVRSR